VQSAGPINGHTNAQPGEANSLLGCVATPDASTPRHSGRCDAMPGGPSHAAPTVGTLRRDRSDIGTTARFGSFEHV
jgi:hypothetical protein